MIPSSEIIHIESTSILKRYDPTDRLRSYFTLLMEENSRVNLVSRETSDDDLRRLAAESLLPFDVFDPVRVDRYLDIGSGGGFPAFPILLCRNIAQSVLVERTIKKAAALERIVTSLNEQSELAVRIVNKSFEEWKSSGKFDLITLRLVRLVPLLLKKILPLLNPGGCFIYYAAPEKLSVPAGYDVRTVRYSSDQSDVIKSVTLIRKKQNGA